MKTLTRLSKKAIQFCELSGYDVEKVKESMKSNSFSFKKCENAEEIQENGVSNAFPYTIYNPFGLNINK